MNFYWRRSIEIERISTFFSRSCSKYFPGRHYHYYYYYYRYVAFCATVTRREEEHAILFLFSNEQNYDACHGGGREGASSTRRTFSSEIKIAKSHSIRVLVHVVLLRSTSVEQLGGRRCLHGVGVGYYSSHIVRSFRHGRNTRNNRTGVEVIASFTRVEYN